MTSPEYQAPTWVNEDHPDFIEGVSPDLGAGYLNQLSGAVEDHGQRLGAAESDVATLQATALDQADGDARYILQSNAAGFAPAEATANALAALPFRADNVTTTGAAVGKLPAVDDASPLHFALIDYFKVLAGNPDLLIAGAITRDANGAATAAPVVWPDGRPGVYTATIVSTAFPGAVDAYTVSYDGVETDFTYTQPAVTRDSTTGAVTARPAMTVA